VDGLRKDIDGLLGLKERVQTLESTVQELRKENQRMRELLSAREGDHWHHMYLGWVSALPWWSFSFRDNLRALSSRIVLFRL
ncbi:hypothetical protein Tco_0557537, partial [Tanacetum coccineum]